MYEGMIALLGTGYEIDNSEENDSENMKNKFNGTTGKISISREPFLEEDGIEYAGAFRLINENGDVFCEVAPYEFWNSSFDKAKANAELITDAANTYSECGLYPSELLAEINRLKKQIK